MLMKWGDLQKLADNDPEFRKRNGSLLAELSAKPGSKNSARGRNNRADGQRFEDEITAVFNALWLYGAGMVFNTGPATVNVGRGEIRYKRQQSGRFIPPQNPPDYMGQLYGYMVTLDAKVSHSSSTYYATRAKKSAQHAGILAVAHGVGYDSLVGYMIEWSPECVSFVHVLDAQDGKVRRKLSIFEGETPAMVIQQWIENLGEVWPLN